MLKEKDLQYFKTVMKLENKYENLCVSEANKKDESKPNDSFITLMNRHPIAMEYTFNLSDIEFDQEKNVLGLLEILRNATQHDIIKIYCSSNGGSVYIALRILNAIQDCDAIVVTIGDSYVHSAASLILLSGDIIEVKGFCNMLVHDVSSFVGGKSSTMANEISFQQDWKLDLFNKCYSGFLTKEEIKDLSEGKDYHFQSKDILARLHKMADYKMKIERREIMVYDKKKMDEDALKSIQEQEQKIMKKINEEIELAKTKKETPKKETPKKETPKKETPNKKK